MHYSQYRFTLDLQKHQSQQSVAMFKGDTAVRLYMNLTDGGKPYIIKQGSYAVLFGKRPDGEPLLHSCEIDENKQEIIYEFQATTTAAVGIVDCQCRLYGADQKLITAPRFSIVVDEGIVGDDEEIEVPGQTLSALNDIILADIARDNAEASRVYNEGVRIENENARQAVFETEGEHNLPKVKLEALPLDEITEAVKESIDIGDIGGGSIGDINLDGYAKTEDLTNGSLVVAKATSAESATNATSAESATRASQDADGNVIPDTYAKKAELLNGTLVPEEAMYAEIARNIELINDNKMLKLFVGEKSEYDRLSDEDKQNLFALITDDTAKEDILNEITTLESNLLDGTIQVAKATSADSATRDNNGNIFDQTYAKTSDLTDGTIQVAKATEANYASQAGRAGTANSADTATTAGCLAPTATVEFKIELGLATNVTLEENTLYVIYVGGYALTLFVGEGGYVYNSSMGGYGTTDYVCTYLKYDNSSKQINAIGVKTNGNVEPISATFECKAIRIAQLPATPETPETPSTVISFAIGEEVYYADSGMTWGEWVESEYNTGGLYVVFDSGHNFISFPSGARPVQPNSNDVGVQTTDIIIENHNYATVREK